MPSKLLFEDTYGEIIDRPAAGFIEIRWFDTTIDMTGTEFQNWLLKFTDLTEQGTSRRVLVDATSFRMQSMEDTTGWRDEVIIPRYNTIGITKFSFHLPAGAPPIGRTPVPEGPANFPTGYFATREEATEWLVT